MKTISFTIPMERATLVQTATYLRLLGYSLPEGNVADDNSSPSIEDITQAEINAGNLPAPKTLTQVEAGLKANMTTPPATGTPAPEAEAPAPPAPAPETETLAPPPPSTETPEAETATPAGVVLDSAGLPWDGRIHVGTKTRIQRTDQWKPKRSVDAALVAQVEAELKATMAAPGPTPSSPPAPQAQAGTETPAPATTPLITIDPAAITNFAEFMSACTKVGVAPESIVAACLAHGVAAPTLLAARPDLVPAVALTLFAPEV